MYVCMGRLNPALLALCVWWGSNAQRSEMRSSFGCRLGGERLEKKRSWVLGRASTYLDYQYRHNVIYGTKNSAILGSSE